MSNRIENSANLFKATVQIPYKDGDYDNSSITGDVDEMERYSAEYYRDMNLLNLRSGKDENGKDKQKGFGYCAQVAALETATAFGLMISDARSLNIFKSSGALFANAASTLAEFAQVFIGGNFSVDEKRAEHVSNAFIGAAGGFGLYKSANDVKKYFTGEAEEPTESTLFEKVLYTIGSIASGFFMFTNSAEKQLVAKLGEEDIDEEKRGMIEVDGRQDGRCFIEWSTMVPYIWLKSFEPFKLAVDVALPAMSFADAVGHFTGFDKFEEWTSVKLLGNRTWFGTESNPGGLREKVFTPILRNVYGLNAPTAHVNQDDSITASADVPAIPEVSHSSKEEKLAVASRGSLPPGSQALVPTGTPEGNPGSIALSQAPSS